ncbi:hypothetical protein IPN35_03420 [Candidatus Peregrinibacteria bacterium]|nr:MAG: hypothetical protein IPN35_03420 [Candidatus Peregrinibacteria bacterium]
MTKTANMTIKEVADLLHIGETSAELYIEFLTHGDLSRTELMNFVKRDETEVEMGIQELLQRDLILPGRVIAGTQIFQAMPITDLEKRVKKSFEMLENVRDIVVPKLYRPEKIGFVKYEGVEGIRNVYEEILLEAIEEKQDIFAFENIPDKNTSNIGKDFLESYLKRRIEAKVLARVIIPDTPAGREYKKENKDNPFTKVSIIKDFDIQGTINITGDLVMSYALSPPQGILRRNTIEANDFKQIFSFCWNKINRDQHSTS